MAELRREPILRSWTESSESSTLIRTIALKAEAMLGYSWLRRRLRIEATSLANTLKELAIEPFRVADVKQYKREKAHLAEQQALAEYRARARRDGFLGLPPGTRVQTRWNTVSLKNYEGEVPEFALSRAMEIKERMPTAEFEIEELRVEKRYDPFLVASYGRERFYIDVWDEREFEADEEKGFEDTELP